MVRLASEGQQRRLQRSPNVLKTLMFLGLCQQADKSGLNSIDPSLFSTLDELRRHIVQCCEEGFEFIGSAELTTRHRGRLAVLTFDDGYANNLLVLPLLHELRVPATFFISTYHMLSSECFWWDVLRRNLQNGPLLSKTRRQIKRHGPRAIGQRLIDAFGPASFQPSANSICR